MSLFAACESRLYSSKLFRHPLEFCSYREEKSPEKRASSDFPPPSAVHCQVRHNVVAMLIVLSSSQGICESGARCTCPFAFETGCEDGSVNVFQGCSCTVPLCEMYAKTCTAWTSPNSTRVWSYRTDCTNTWPVVTPVSPDSPTRVYIILKEWDLTTSRGVIAPLGDSSSWELTRRRALGIGEPDQWHIYANDYCIPSFSDLDSGVSRDSVLWEHHDYRNGWTKRE